MELVWFGLLVGFLILFPKCLIDSKDIIDENVIKQPILYLVIGIGGICCFFIIGLYFIIVQFDLIAIAFLWGFALLYIPILPFAINWKIELYDDGFIYTNMFAKKRKVFFDDVTLKDTGKGCFVYDKNGKRIVGVSYLQPNSDALEKVYNDYMKTKRKNKSKSV